MLRKPDAGGQSLGPTERTRLCFATKETVMNDDCVATGETPALALARWE
jgi:hypothetical protein